MNTHEEHSEPSSESGYDAHHDDRVLSPEEFEIMKMQVMAEGLKQMLALGHAVPGVDLSKAEHFVNLTDYLASLSPEELEIVSEEIHKGDLPPEVLAPKDSFIVSGPSTVQ